VTRIIGTLREDVRTFMTIPHLILLRVRSFSDKIFIKNQSTHFIFDNFGPEIRAVCEIKLENIVKPDRPQMAVLYCPWTLHVGYLRLQTHTQNM